MAFVPLGSFASFSKSGQLHSTIKNTDLLPENIFFLHFLSLIRNTILNYHKRLDHYFIIAELSDILLLTLGKLQEEPLAACK